MFSWLRRTTYYALHWLLILLVGINLAMPVWAFTEIQRGNLRIDLSPAPSGFVVQTDLQYGPNLTPEQRQAIETTLYHLPTLPWEKLGIVDIDGQTEPGTNCGYADLARKKIVLRSRCQTMPLTHVFAHELGHIVDAELMTAARRLNYCDRRAIPNCADWYQSTHPTTGDSDLHVWRNSPAEDFAEEFVRFALDSRYSNQTNYAETEDLSDFWQELLAVQ